MAYIEHIEIDITVISEGRTTLRDLKNLRSSLASEMEHELSGNNVEFYQESASRSVDPAVIGTVTLILLPVLIEKVADIIIKWVELHNDCSVTISIPVKGGSPILVTYDPRTTSKATLKTWINSAMESVEKTVGKNTKKQH